MKTFCSFAIVCVIALGQTSFGLANPEEYDAWSQITRVINGIGADAALDFATCHKEIIEANGLLVGSDGKNIKDILSEYAKCILPGNVGCFEVMSRFDSAVNKLCAYEYKNNFDIYKRVNDDLYNICVPRASAYLEKRTTNH